MEMASGGGSHGSGSADSDGRKSSKDMGSVGGGVPAPNRSALNGMGEFILTQV